MWNNRYCSKNLDTWILSSCYYVIYHILNNKEKKSNYNSKFGSDKECLNEKALNDKQDIKQNKDRKYNTK